MVVKQREPTKIITVMKRGPPTVQRHLTCNRRSLTLSPLYCYRQSQQQQQPNEANGVPTAQKRLPKLTDDESLPSGSSIGSSFSSTGARISDREVEFSSDEDDALFSSQPMTMPAHPRADMTTDILSEEPPTQTTPTRRRSFGGGGGSSSKYRRHGNHRQSCHEFQAPPALSLADRRSILPPAISYQPPYMRSSAAEHMMTADYADRPPSSVAESSLSSPVELMYSQIRKSASAIGNRRAADGSSLAAATSCDSLRLKEKAQAAARQRRLCFREAFSLSSIKEISPISTTISAPRSRLFNSPEGATGPRCSNRVPPNSPPTADIGQQTTMADDLIMSSPDSEQSHRRVMMPPPPAPIHSPSQLLFRSPCKPVPKTNPYFGNTPSKVRLGVAVRRSGSIGGVRPSSAIDPPYRQQQAPTDADYATRDRPAAASHATQRALRGLKTFGIKGQLYLIIQLNRGIMTVTVDVGKHFQSGTGQPCNSYVRISLVPEESIPQHRTNLVPRTNNPIFNQSFSFDLKHADCRKRVLISVWNKDLATQNSSLLGCMAFTVKHVSQPNKEVNGWYFLLAPSVGQKKHLAVDKVKMLTYYGSVDSGLQTASDGSVSATEDTRRSRRYSLSVDVNQTSVCQHQYRPLPPLLHERTAETTRFPPLKSYSSLAPTPCPPAVNNLTSVLPAGADEITASTTDTSASHRGCVSGATSELTGSTNNSNYYRGNYYRPGITNGSVTTTSSSSFNRPPAVFVMNNFGGDDVTKPCTSVVRADHSPSPDMKHEQDDHFEFLKPSDDNVPIVRAHSCTDELFPAAPRENGNVAGGGVCSRKISAQEMNAYSKQLAMELTMGGGSGGADGGGPGQARHKKFAIDFDSQAANKNTQKKRSFAGPFVKGLNFLKKRSTGDNDFDFGGGRKASALLHAKGGGAAMRSVSVAAGGGHQRAAASAAHAIDAQAVAKASTKLTQHEVLLWQHSFERLLKNKHGLALFKLFLQREFSDENVEFWIACEEYKKVKESKLAPKAKEIYQEFVAKQAPREVNLDGDTRAATLEALDSASPATFETAQAKVEHLMEKDSYPRFLKCDLYLELIADCKK